MSPGSYNVKDQSLIGDAQSRPSLEVKFRLNIEGQEMVFTRPVQYKYTDPVKGELYQPLTILPPVTGRFDPELVLFMDGEQKDFEVQTKVQTSHDLQPKISLTNTGAISVKQTGGGGSNFIYSAKPGSKETELVYSDLLFEKNGKPDTARELKTVAYDHIPRIDYFRTSQEKFVVADIRISGKRIGYIEGAGDKVPQALEQM